MAFFINQTIIIAIFIAGICAVPVYGMKLTRIIALPIPLGICAIIAFELILGVLFRQFGSIFFLPIDLVIGKRNKKVLFKGNNTLECYILIGQFFQEWYFKGYQCKVSKSFLLPYSLNVGEIVEREIPKGGQKLEIEYYPISRVLCSCRDSCTGHVYWDLSLRKAISSRGIANDFGNKHELQSFMFSFNGQIAEIQNGIKDKKNLLFKQTLISLSPRERKLLHAIELLFFCIAAYGIYKRNIAALVSGISLLGCMILYGNKQFLLKGRTITYRNYFGLCKTFRTDEVGWKIARVPYMDYEVKILLFDKYQKPFASVRADTYNARMLLQLNHCGAISKKEIGIGTLFLE